MVIREGNGSAADKYRKILKFFKSYDQNTDIAANLKEVEFLEVNLSRTLKPY